MNKVYVTKEGLRFKITGFHRPNEGDIVHFIRLEFDYLKSQNLTPKEFKVIYMLKMHDFRYDPTPLKETSELKRLAEKYGTLNKFEIASKNVEKETEVRKQESKK